MANTLESGVVAEPGAERKLASGRQAKLLFFGAAFMSFAMSIYLFFGVSPEKGIFVGLWVPSILSAGNLLMTRPDHD